MTGRHRGYVFATEDGIVAGLGFVDPGTLAWPAVCR